MANHATSAPAEQALVTGLAPKSNLHRSNSPVVPIANVAAAAMKRTLRSCRSAASRRSLSRRRDSEYK